MCDDAGATLPEGQAPTCIVDVYTVFLPAVDSDGRDMLTGTDGGLWQGIIGTYAVDPARTAAGCYTFKSLDSRYALYRPNVSSTSAAWDIASYGYAAGCHNGGNMRSGGSHRDAPPASGWTLYHGADIDTDNPLVTVSPGPCL
jgi:hypothetical protein